MTEDGSNHTCMNTFKKLKTLLESSTQIHTPGINTFLSLDIKNTKKKLGLEEKAKEYGSKQLPSSDSDDFDEVESKIINFIEAERARCLHQFNDHLTTYNQRLANLNIETCLTQATLAAREATGDFKERIHQGQDNLTNSKNDVMEHARYLESFKLENKLNRPAHYPRSTLFHWGIVAILYLVEASLNSAFLSVGNELGLLGGFGEAVAIAFLNIGVALFFGAKIMPWIWHVGIYKKLIGIGLILVLLVATFSFNILVAHYRDALASTMADQATVIAISSFRETPFGITDFKSWMMVGVGCFFAIIALIDGFKMDDPYPNYGNVERRQRRAYETYADKKALLLDDLKDTRDYASSALAQLKDDLVKRRQEHDFIIANRQNLLVNLETHQNYLESCGRELITFYRARNREARNTPPPKYFDRAWCLERRHSPILPATSLSDERLNDVMTKASSTIQSAISKVMDAFDQAIVKIKQIDEIISHKEADRVEA
ncbi:MAG: hypothetical protein PHG36_03650 [Dehalococcoidia bacterium]|nr:hypothetical protein [Dehalococcoidia bacterium]